MTRGLPALAALLLLSACGGGADDQSDEDERTASGEVLEGSISDAMIAQEELTSQPPRLKDAPRSATGDDAAESDADASEGEEGEAGDAAEAAEPESGPAAPAPATEAAPAE